MKTARDHYDEAMRRCSDRFAASYIIPSERNLIIRNECIAAIEAASAEERARWHEWLRLRYSDEWIAACGDLPS